MGNLVGKNILPKNSEPYEFRPFRFEKVVCVSSCESCTSPPQPRSGHRIVCDSGNLYSFGGYSPSLDDNKLFKELWKLNLASKKWSQYNNKHTIPRQVASNAVLLIDNVLLVYGGTGLPFGGHCNYNLYACHLNGHMHNTMYKIPTSGNPPMPQYGQAIVRHENYLYTIGGTNGFVFTCDIHRLNLTTSAWEEVYEARGQSSSEPAGRYRHEVGYDGKYIYVLGGGTGDHAYSFNVIPMFNLCTNQWKKGKSISDPCYGLPRARRCHGAVQVQSATGAIYVYISGGVNGNNVHNDVWRLELSTLKWTLVVGCELENPTYFHSAAVTPEGKMYIFGGIVRKADNEKRTDEVYSAWVTIPSLAEICWEAILHYCPKICEENPEVLVRTGLPKKFFERLR